MKPEDFDRLVRARRSVRGYLPDPVDPAVIEAAFAAALWAPSNCNVQPWAVHLVSGARLRALGVTPDALAATGILPPGLDAGEAAAGGAALPLPVERLILLAVVNAGARLLATGRALRPSDLDLAMVLGAGWPNWRGGPMAEADGLGLPAKALRIEAKVEGRPAVFSTTTMIDRPLVTVSCRFQERGGSNNGHPWSIVERQDSTFCKREEGFLFRHSHAGHEISGRLAERLEATRARIHRHRLIQQRLDLGA